MLMDRLKTKYKTNEPIFTNEILDMFSEYSRAYIFRLINQAEKKGEIINFDTGIYFIPSKSIIGNSTITVDDVVYKKYIGYKNDIYGIYSGLNLQNKFSVTNQMPNTIEIITNNESMRCRKITIDGRTIILRKSRCEITPINAKVYAILQLLTEMDISDGIDVRIKNYLKKFIEQNKISNFDLISLAKFFPAQTTKKLIYGGLLYDIT